jgi:hypothetical protein
MPTQELEHKKLALAAEKIVHIVSAKVGNWINVPRIMLYGEQSEKHRETVFSTLESYGFYWDESEMKWMSKSPMPAWLEELATD